MWELLAILIFNGTLHVQYQARFNCYAYGLNVNKSTVSTCFYITLIMRNVTYSITSVYLNLHLTTRRPWKEDYLVKYNCQN